MQLAPQAAAAAFGCPSSSHTHPETGNVGREISSHTHPEAGNVGKEKQEGKPSAL